MSDTDAGSSSANAGAGDGGWDEAGTNGAATLREVARIASERGFGEARIVRVLGGGDVGCTGVGLAFLLLLPGFLLLLGPYGFVARTIGVTLLAIAVALPFAAIGYEKRRDNRIPRLHVFDGGMIIAHPDRIAAYAWPQIRVVERIDRVAIGQGGSQQSVYRLQLLEVDGEALCSLGQTPDAVTTLRLAIAGGARTS
jgi:hypothetical protein